MTSTTFDRDAMARWYAAQHVKVDSEIVDIYHLPTGASDREIRLVEVTRGYPERTHAVLEPIELGIDRGTPSQHLLSVVDLTPGEWNRIRSGDLALPNHWSLDGFERLAAEGKPVRRRKAPAAPRP